MTTMENAVPTAVMARLISSARPTTPPWTISLYAFSVSPCGTSTRPPAMLMDAWVEKLVSTMEYIGSRTSSRMTAIVPVLATWPAADGRSSQTGRRGSRRAPGSQCVAGPS